jgi:hypothetical protein
LPNSPDDLILKSFLFPPINYFGSIKSRPSISIDVEENYQKRSFRNKYIVLGSNGKLVLSVPLQKGKNNNQNIKDVKIAFDEDWQKKHIESIKSCYGKAAYFEDYFEAYERLIKKKNIFLHDLNMDGLYFISKAFKLDVVISEVGQYQKEIVDFPINELAYPQVFEHKFGFTNDLSVIDLLFNMGPESRLYF